jgi:Fic family protein
MDYLELPDYQHLQFRRCWELPTSVAINLGKCVAMINCIGMMPIAPAVQAEFRRVSFERGAQATTAIEGNTLSDAELQQVLDGIDLPESRKYQAREVENALHAMSQVWADVVQAGSRSEVSPKLLMDINGMIGKNLGNLYDGIPGRFRADRRHVGKYLAPPEQHVEKLVADFCRWLREEFRYHSGKQPMENAIIQAIVAHVYFEWIHPFADGNGRTGRMLEFYILLRAGLPDVTAHVLANHYNNTRQEYTAHFDNARKKRNLTDFLSYAIQGFVDGLASTMEKVHEHVVSTVWREMIYEAFRNYTDYTKKTIFVRRRELALSMPLDRSFTPVELVRTSDSLTEKYMGLDKRALHADINVLAQLGLAIRDESDAGKNRYMANFRQLTSNHVIPRAMPTSKSIGLT